MTYPIQPGASFRAAQTGKKPSNTLFGRTTLFCTDVYRLLSNSSSSRAPWGKQPNSWTPWLFFWDQGFPVEYRLDTFNAPHTGTILRHPQNWQCQLRCLIPLLHLATTSPLGNIFWRHSCLSTNNQNHKLTVTLTSLSSNRNMTLLHMANIIPRMSNNTHCYLNSLITLLLSFPTRLAAQTQTLHSMLPLKTFM